MDYKCCVPNCKTGYEECEETKQTSGEKREINEGRK